MTASTAASRAGFRARLRTRRTRRLAFTAVLLATVASLVSSSVSGGASADIAPGSGAAQSLGAQATVGTVALTPAVTAQTGTLINTALGLLGINLNSLLTALTTSVVNPLSAALTALPQQTVNGLATAITNAGLQANNPTGQQPRPADGTYPTCGQQGWTADDCYGPLTPTIPAGPIATVSTGTVQGYATGDGAGYIAAAHAAHAQLSVLGVNLGDLGVVDSSAQCGTTAASCTATQTLSSSANLLGGHLALSIADGGALLAKIDGVSIPAAGQTITVGGLATTVTVNGNLATLTIGLSHPQLHTALGLTNLLAPVLGIGPLVDGGSTVALTVTIGPGNISASSPASAWGLEVGINLSVDVKLNIGATVTIGLQPTTLTLATVEVKTGGTAPDLLDLKLAYSTATAGTLLPGWVPPALI